MNYICLLEVTDMLLPKIHAKAIFTLFLYYF